MDVIEMLRKQSKDTYLWVDKLISTMPDTKWEEQPNGLESTISWQVGHLVISVYYHTILVVEGHQSDIFVDVPIKKYAELFGLNSKPENIVGIFTPSQLREHLNIVTEKSLAIIGALTLEELEEKLMPAGVEHPVAKTKFEAIDWNIKHTMWHCGQIASLKRLLGHPTAFSLKKS